MIIVYGEYLVFPFKDVFSGRVVSFATRLFFPLLTVLGVFRWRFLLSGHFDHTTRYHLCIPDLGVVMEFAAGTFIALPSALLEHHNIHSDQFEVYATQGGSEFREKRGTLVLFTQGNVMMSAEKGMTAAEGKREGVDMKCEYGLDAFNCAVFD